MKNNGSLMKPVILIWLAFAAILVMAALCPSQALAQVPARFYWKTLSGCQCGAAHLRFLKREHKPVDLPIP